MVENVVKEIDSILAKNRNILRECSLAGKLKVSENELLLSGFNSNYHTSQIKHDDGKKIFEFCYEFGIAKLDDVYFEIIKLPL